MIEGTRTKEIQWEEILTDNPKEERAIINPHFLGQLKPSDMIGVLNELAEYSLERKDAVAGFKRRRLDLFSDGVMDLMTVSGRS
ncbi:hypothetical protein Tco_0876228 [Tanacetum coccineum]|uniref:Uncharacterized protein n=1 Tax=Tanacetum coccineum TaxID=301880 RepID=A0ABQ5BUH0_9ASTR